jgi:FixJ family two-component response regulator
MVNGRDLSRIKAAFDSAGLYSVANHLDMNPSDALDVLINSGLLPQFSGRHRAVLHRLVNLRDSSHVAVAEALHISRWTVAAYRRQLGIDLTACRPTRT